MPIKDTAARIVHKTTCAINSTGHRGPCTCGAESSAATASADVDWRAAWEASVKVVAAAGRFIEAEREGNAALIEDAHFGLLKALADYRAGAA